LCGFCRFVVYYEKEKNAEGGAAVNAIKLPVRKVVELVLRCGDIDSRYVDSSVMLEGARAHRKLQKMMGSGYQREVPLRIEAWVGDIPVIIQGRADGVITEEDGGVTVDEIKTTTLPLERVYGQRALHMGQAKCYAHMLLQTMEEPPEEVTVQLTYYQLETEELERYRQVFSRGELEGFFTGLLEEYGVWLRFERDWRSLRGASIKSAGFPFDSYRSGQRKLAATTYRAIRDRRRLYVQAPTGIGKTMSTLFPAVKAVGEGEAEKLFYLTAKTVTRAVAEDAVGLMASRGLRFKSLTLRAKEKICFCEETICNPDSCPYARGHYDRVNAALLDILEGCDLITPEVVTRYAEKHRVCPHEYALDIALWADLVICDYNHVFDPTVYLKRFFNDAGGDYVFLIDEAHNLADRVRDMYTPSLDRRDFTRIKKELKDKNAAAKSLRRTITAIASHLSGLGQACGPENHRVSQDLDQEFYALVMRFIAAAEEWLAQEQHTGHPQHRQMLELYFGSLFFAQTAELFDERFTVITEAAGGNVGMTLFCLDPSCIIGKALGRARASILFSATLTPLPYYREILGGTEEDGILALPSPFRQERLLLAVHRGISTKYIHRPGSIGPIAQAVYQAVAQKAGNYIVYFPSHLYMRQVYERFTQDYPGIPTALQQGRMDEGERRSFLERFDAANSGTLVGFCVLGGIFSEGIDLKGDRLIGSIIVGVGLPQISLRQDQIRAYFDAKNGRGYDYAYVYPGMNKVLQAAGRVIRSETDYGLVLLIDSRFDTTEYRALYPGHWAHLRTVRNPGELEKLTEAFPFFHEPAE